MFLAGSLLPSLSGIEWSVFADSDMIPLSSAEELVYSTAPKIERVQEKSLLAKADPDQAALIIKEAKIHQKRFIARRIIEVQERVKGRND